MHSNSFLSTEVPYPVDFVDYKQIDRTNLLYTNDVDKYSQAEWTTMKIHRQKLKDG